ncbi:MAG: DUF3516 domain-containing protein [Caldilineae bacterium]|nr:DUF3516 domain-containing protein [Caldilineae bacterium]
MVAPADPAEGPSTGLADRLPPAGETLTPMATLDRFLDWVAASGLTPYAHQEAALLELYSGQHVVLATPTGSGKSLVATGLEWKALCEDTWCVYTSPIKALASEKFFQLCEVFGPEQVGMLTGDASINRDAPIICCTAEILSNMALRDDQAFSPPYVIMDEFHYYSDAERGVAWQVPLITMPRTQFLLMSATLGDTSEIQRLLAAQSGRDVVEIASAERPVPLDFSYRDSPLQTTVQVLLAEQRAPIYIVSFTQRECAELAQALLSIDVCSPTERKAIGRAIAGARFDSPYGREIRRFLAAGIAVHHAGLLPRYRLLVEQLAQQGLLKVICGTDTLGVGVNIPIRTVLFNKLVKYDGKRLGILSARDFHQIAGRAGRKGFDDRGSVVCQAPEHVIENKKASDKAAATGRKARSKKPPPGTVVWSQQTFDQLVSRQPETLISRFRVSHGMMINVLQREVEPAGYRFLVELIARCHESEPRKAELRREAAELFRALRRAGIVEPSRDPVTGRPRVLVSEALQDEFALHDALSLFAVDAVLSLDPTAPSFALDVLSVVEAIQQDPRAILIAQERKVKGDLIGRLKAEGVPYEERMAQLDQVTHPKPPKPLTDFLLASFQVFAQRHPWVRAGDLAPKAIAREMAEGYWSFEDMVRRYGFQRFEGLLLRYLSQVYKAMVQTVPEQARDEAVLDLIAYLRTTLERVDSSLLDEWERMMGLAGPDEVERAGETYDLARDPAALEARIRAELLALVRALAAADYEEAARAVHAEDPEAWDAERFEAALAPFLAEHGRIVFEPRTRKRAHCIIRPSGHRQWSADQILVDPDGDNLWHVAARVDLNGVHNPAGPIIRVWNLGT